MKAAGLSINDHFKIRMGRKAFTPADALALHAQSRAWLEAELAKPWAGKTVVATHHGCNPQSIHHRFIGDPINAAFISDLSDLTPFVDLWLHGHVHNSFDYQLGRCRVVANPAGYIRNWRHAVAPVDFEFENPHWNAALVVDV